MHTVDVLAVCAAVLVLVLCALILARQRYMLRSAGSIPLAVRSGNRWLYGIARYIGGELRWYRSLGLGTRPTRVFLRSELYILGHRAPTADEARSLPANAVIVDCRVGSGEVVIALGEGAYTGFISWIESSAPAT